MPKVFARRRAGYTHDVEIEGGHTLVIDEPVADGGANEGPSPTRTLAAALAACTAITAEMYGDRKGWDLGALEVEVEISYDGPSPTALRGDAAVPGRPRRRAARAPAGDRAQVPGAPPALAGDDGHRHRRHRPLLDRWTSASTARSAWSRAPAVASAATSPAGSPTPGRRCCWSPAARPSLRTRPAPAASGADALALDVTDPSAGDAIVAAATERLGPPDVVVNNAGSVRWRDLEDLTDDDWQAAWDLNVMAPMRLMRAAVPGMRERGWGRIVNVSSTAGKRPTLQMPEYSVAKAAELSLSRLYADLYARDGVLVNAVCPGPATSELWMAPGGVLDQSRAAAGESREEALKAMGARRPIGRLAEPAEVGAVIAFLCSEQASYVAGAAWSVDGGTVQVII